MELALPFLAVEGAVLAETSGVGVISTIGAMVTNVLAFTGATKVFEDVGKMISPDKTKEVIPPKDVLDKSFMDKKPMKTKDLKKLLNNPIHNL